MAHSISLTNKLLASGCCFHLILLTFIALLNAPKLKHSRPMIFGSDVRACRVVVVAAVYHALAPQSTDPVTPVVA